MTEDKLNDHSNAGTRQGNCQLGGTNDCSHLHFYSHVLPHVKLASCTCGVFPLLHLHRKQVR